MAEPSWRAVANALAERMSHHANCATHPERETDTDCPWCRDRAAYRLWEKKSGQTFVVREVPGEAVNVFDVLWPGRRDDHNEHDTKER